MSSSIAERAASAFENEVHRSAYGRYQRKYGNTWIDREHLGGRDHAVLYLHGNAIARYAIEEGFGSLEITTSDWNTPTTLSRLNALAGVSAANTREALFLNGTPWDGEWTSLFSRTEKSRGVHQRSGERLYFVGSVFHLTTGMKEPHRIEGGSFYKNAIHGGKPAVQTDLTLPTGRKAELTLRPWTDKPSGRIRLLSVPMSYTGRKTMRIEAWEDLDRAIEWAIDATAEGLALVHRLITKAQEESNE